MKRTMAILLVTCGLLSGCDFGKEQREKSSAIYKANAEAKKDCYAKLSGLKKIPIAGTNEKLFLDADKLPMWSLRRGFRAGEECGAENLGVTQTFYWDGNKIISRYNWIVRDKKSPWLIHKNWVQINADIYLFTPPNQSKNYSPHLNNEVQPIDSRKINIIQLKNYPVDARPVIVKNKHIDKRYILTLRDWPMENGGPRYLGLACDVTGSINKIKNIDFKQSDAACSIDYKYFKFKSGSAFITFDARDLDKITPILERFKKYLNDAISEEK